MKKNVYYSLSVIFIIFLFVLYIGGNTSNLNHVKLNQIYTTFDELEQESYMIVEIDNIQKQEIINYGGIDFIISEVNLNRSIKNNESVENIKILQTNVAEDPILVNNQKYLLFLDEYEGPVASDVYVILGMYQGQFKIINDNLIKTGKSEIDTSGESYSRLMEKFESNK